MIEMSEKQVEGTRECGWQQCDQGPWLSLAGPSRWERSPDRRGARESRGRGGTEHVSQYPQTPMDGDH